jgi:hypothetical protein
MRTDGWTKGGCPDNRGRDGEWGKALLDAFADSA